MSENDDIVFIIIRVNEPCLSETSHNSWNMNMPGKLNKAVLYKRYKFHVQNIFYILIYIAIKNSRCNRRKILSRSVSLEVRDVNNNSRSNQRHIFNRWIIRLVDGDTYTASIMKKGNQIQCRNFHQNCPVDCPEILIYINLGFRARWDLMGPALSER